MFQIEYHDTQTDCTYSHTHKHTHAYLWQMHWFHLHRPTPAANFTSYQLTKVAKLADNGQESTVNNKAKNSPGDFLWEVQTQPRREGYRRVGLSVICIVCVSASVSVSASASGSVIGVVFVCVCVCVCVSASVICLEKLSASCCCQCHQLLMN